MCRRPPRSTRTTTLFPYTTLFRSEITGHQVDVTPALNDYVNTKLERIARHFDHHLDLRVILTVDKLEQRAEATVGVPGKSLFADASRSEEHTSELQSLMRISYAVFCLKKKKLY